MDPTPLSLRQSRNRRRSRKASPEGAAADEARGQAVKTSKSAVTAMTNGLTLRSGRMTQGRSKSSSAEIPLDLQLHGVNLGPQNTAVNVARIESQKVGSGAPNVSTITVSSAGIASLPRSGARRRRLVELQVRFQRPRLQVAEKCLTIYIDCVRNALAFLMKGTASTAIRPSAKVATNMEHAGADVRTKRMTSRTAGAQKSTRGPEILIQPEVNLLPPVAKARLSVMRTVSA